MAETFRFLSSEEFERLGQREKVEYLDRAVIEALRLRGHLESSSHDTRSESSSPDPDNASRTDEE